MAEASGLTLHFHPLSSFCQKVLVALYENDTPFRPQHVDLFDEAQRAAFLRLWPVGRFPVLRDDARGRTVPESTIIIEYLSHFYPGSTALVPADPGLALETRELDRLFDLYVNVPMQKIVTDRLRPEGRGDAQGVEDARALLLKAYGVLEARLAGRAWANGMGFSMADCAAAPALRYADMTLPLGGSFPVLAGYLERLKQRPSFARAIAEGEPFMKLIPQPKEGAA
ncbi:MAG: glutathione S-transferase family protein [Geminicoccaceae bacterium]